MFIRREAALLNDNAAGVMAKDIREVFQNAGFSASTVDLFMERVVGILDDYTVHFGEGKKVVYTIQKGLMKMRLRILIHGEAFDPFTNGSGAWKRFIDSIFNLNERGSSGISYLYARKNNIISLGISLEDKPQKLIKDPVVWGVLLGFACGFLCKLLPQELNSFIVDEITSPLQSIILSIISGVMGPVIFFSLLSSVIALESIDNLTGLGFRIIRRFLVIILFLILVSLLVSGLVFANFGAGGRGFSLALLFRMLFDVFPTNMIEPFLNNNTAQLVILGFLAGAGLLLIGDRGSDLKRIIEQCNTWIMSVMKIVLLTLPAVPFLSITTIIASGKTKDLLSGWKFILASYLAFSVCIVIKGLKTSFKTGNRISDLWQKVKPVAKISLTTGSTTAALKRVYEVSDEAGIKTYFSSFWIPMSTAMLSPKTAVNVVITAFMAAQLENMPVSYSFLVVMIIMATELSTASPGIPAACTAMLKSLGLPVDYVGLITTYRLLTDNYGAACAISYNVLEEIEIAHKLGEIEGSNEKTPV